VSTPIVVVDYDAGNTRSVERALVSNGADVLISADPEWIERAPGLVLPGVGAAADTMHNLRSRSLVRPILDYIASGKPFLGVCMGLQALLEWSEEGGREECLGVVPGHVVRFRAPGLKVPHMGWNTVGWLREHPITEGIPSDSYFYFVHSYHPVLHDQSWALGETEYGVCFPSVIARDNVVATQFHPEKSSEQGLRIYGNFVRWVERESAATVAAVNRVS
jgi:imidazole glycerol-phosphate synthase subunit HisH